jgi:hypothetical protein
MEGLAPACSRRRPSKPKKLFAAAKSETFM